MRGETHSHTIRNVDPGVSESRVVRWSRKGPERRSDRLIVEEPLEIRLTHGTERQQTSISVTMRTPGEDAELALGFLYTERVISSARDVEAIEPCGKPDPSTGLINTIRVTLRPEVAVDLERLRRNVYTTSSCGVCGKTSIEAVSVATSAIESGLRVSSDVIGGITARLDELQCRFIETGGSHAAALCDPGGALVSLREDVGRHNAVDKLIGAMLRDGHPDSGQSILVLSGRAGFELVQKAIVASIPVVVAVGAPSSLSVALAGKMGLTLVGFARGDSFVVYADRGERIGRSAAL